MISKVNLNTLAGKVIFSVIRIEAIKGTKREPATGFVVSEEIDKEISIRY